MIKYSIIILLSLIAISCKESAKDGEAPIPTLVKAFTITDVETGSLRFFPGTVLATEEANLSFEVSGRLIQLPIREGMRVEEGTLLASLDPKRFADRVSEQQANLDLAKTEYDRGLQLIEKNYISQSQLDILQAKYEIALANLGIAQYDLDHTVLYAPFTGVVAVKYVDNHEHVEAKQNILSLQDIEHVDIKVHIPEYIILNLQQGSDTVQPVALFDTLPGREFPVVFKEFSAQADPETQTYRVIFTMAAPEDVNIFPGMSVVISVVIPDYRRATGDYFLVPSSAVFSDRNDQSSVYVIDPQTMQLILTPVEVGKMTGEQIAILSGLNQGDTIVAAGVHFLQEGQTIRILQEGEQ